MLCRSILVVAPLALISMGSDLSAQELGPDDGHRHDAPAHFDETPMASLTPEERNRVRRLLQEIMCDCPRENYSRTLSNCPDACAKPQKMIIRRMVKDGNRDEEILQTMLHRVQQDQRVLARAVTPFGRAVYVLPFAFLAFGLAVAGFVLFRWSAGGRRDRERREKAGTVLTDEEMNRVERELAELD